MGLSGIESRGEYHTSDNNPIRKETHLSGDDSAQQKFKLINR